MTRRPISFTVPADAGYLRIVRAVACSAATVAGLALDRLDDLALALDEASTVLIGTGAGTALEGTLVVEPDRVEVTIGAGADLENSPWPPVGWHESLTATVLDSVAHDVAFAGSGGRRTVRFTVS